MMKASHSTRRFRLKVSGHSRTTTPTKQRASNTKTKVYDEKSRDYVPRKKGK